MLSEQLVVHNDIANAYLVLGPQVDKLMNGDLRIVFPMKDKKASLQSAPVTAAQPADTPINALIKRIEEREMGSARGASLAAVLPVAALKAMAARLPETMLDMLAMPHVTRANYDKYGAELLKITSGYAVEKMGLLMQYQDELEEETVQEKQDFREDSGSEMEICRPQAGQHAGAARQQCAQHAARSLQPLQAKPAVITTPSRFGPRKLLIETI
ncbi:ATP-dependent DNA helicase hus2 [Operophtera brumata]|uniref:ATP-dependent DNA helicase hus2 n=1 Tax=Operophtera brumata TaxID=104452 RepID=A0A0L7L0X9_OPEBR|nr:ATP-dependent DNA helicase hus2 [Operophtera brumata]